MKHLPLILCIVMSIICLQILGQRIGNQILWNSETASISFEKEPCLQLQKRSENRSPLPPGVHALWKTCVQNQIHEFSARTLEQMLPKFVDDEVRQKLKDIPSNMIPIVQFPSLKSRIDDLCRQKRFSTQYCDEKKYDRTRIAVYSVWNDWMRSSDERARLRGFQWACSHKSAFEISKDLPAAVQLMLHGCTQNKQQAIAHLHRVLTSDPDLTPLIALEARRLNATSLVKPLQEQRGRDEMSKIMIDFALQRLEDKR